MRKITAQPAEETFDTYLDCYTRKLDTLTPSQIELACLAWRLITMDPRRFGEQMAAEYKRRGFTTDLF